MQKAKDELPEITYCLSQYEAAQQADAILVLTEWNEFRHVDWDILAKPVAHPLLIDCRNMYSADQLVANGFQYVGLGKEPQVVHSPPFPPVLTRLPSPPPLPST